MCIEIQHTAHITIIVLFQQAYLMQKNCTLSNLLAA